MYLKFYISFLLASGLCSVAAQEATLTAGGDVTGADGSVSWSVGQIDYINVQGGDGAVTQGVQQPFELFPLSVEGDITKPMAVVIFPNPTSSNAVIRFKEAPPEGCEFVLRDMRGALIQNGKIFGQEVELNVRELPAAVYKLQIIGTAGAIQTFKLVKH